MNVRKSMTNKMISGFCSTYIYYVSITSIQTETERGVRSGTQKKPPNHRGACQTFLDLGLGDKKGYYVVGNDVLLKKFTKQD